MSELRLSIVIPARNESGRIGTTLASVAEYLSRQSYNSEVLVVDNASTDNTSAATLVFSDRIKNLSVVREPRGGKGYAVTAGMRAVRGDLKIFMDADNATDISQLDRLLPFIELGYDVVIGSIAVPGAVISKTEREPWWRVMLGKTGNLVTRLLAVPGIHDTQRGFKLFTAKAADDIFPRLNIFGWTFDFEVLAIARSKGYRIKEVPIEWRHDSDSRVTIWAYPQALRDAFVVAWRRLTRRYKS
ncbi:MAG: dolichyl-phosphate beta-glucosyltransferase [Patescibacteria group bacterium]